MNPVELVGTKSLVVPAWVMYENRLSYAARVLFVMLLDPDHQPLSWPLVQAKLHASREEVADYMDELKKVGAVKVKVTSEATTYQVARNGHFEPVVKEVPRLATASEMAGRPTDSPMKDYGLNDQIAASLAKLQNIDPKWETLAVVPDENRTGFAIVKKLANQYGLGVLTLAFARCVETNAHPTKDATALLTAVCKQLAEKGADRG